MELHLLYMQCDPVVAQPKDQPPPQGHEMREEITNPITQPFPPDSSVLTR